MPLTALPRDPAAVFLTQLRRPARRPLLPSALRGAGAGLLAVVAVSAWIMAANDNFRSVQPGRVFRSAQMDPAELRAAIDRHGIRTVVNLRGTCAGFDWYDAECRATHDAGVSQEDVCLSAIRLPSPTELRRLLEVLDRTEYPILLHCRQGVDRTGLAAVMVRLLEPGVPLPEARRQLHFMFGYVPYNGTEHMARFFDLYEEWLAARDLRHSPEVFRHWAAREYCPAGCRGRLEPPADLPARLAPERRTVEFRAHNTSIRPWRLTPAALQGFHLRYTVHDAAGALAFVERAGQFDAVVPPGESVALHVGLPALPPGRYVLTVEMVDASQNSFTQFGIDPFVWEFGVEPRRGRP